MNKATLPALAATLWFFAAPALPDGGDVEGIRGFPTPEDIDTMPDGRHLLLSPYGGINGEHSRPLYLFDTDSLTARPVGYRREAEPERWDGGRCDSAPGDTFASHGIHISRRDGGPWQVLAVNHDRESVEMFEIVQGDEHPRLAWRGCVVFPDYSILNDLSALPGGGFVVTHMADRTQVDLTEALRLTHKTGHVWRWRPGQGVDVLPGSETNMPNGVAISDDGRHVFIAETVIGQVRKLDYQTGETLGTVPVTSADNFSRAPDGRLLITGMDGPIPDDCLTDPGPCMAPFKVHAIDPETLESEVIHHQNGPPMGAGTVAVIHKGYLYAGSFAGNQMMRVRLCGE